MKKIMLCIMTCAIFLIGCQNQINYETINDTQQNKTFVNNITIEEFQQICWEETMWLCQERCSRISGLIVSDLLSYDGKQFDKNNDGVYNKSEQREWDYVMWEYENCMSECTEDYVYDCFR